LLSKEQAWAKSAPASECWQVSVSGGAADVGVAIIRVNLEVPGEVGDGSLVLTWHAVA